MAHLLTVPWFAQQGDEHPSDYDSKSRRSESFWQTRASLATLRLLPLLACAGGTPHSGPPSRSIPPLYVLGAFRSLGFHGLLQVTLRRGGGKVVAHQKPTRWSPHSSPMKFPVSTLATALTVTCQSPPHQPSPAKAPPPPLYGPHTPPRGGG